MIASIEAVSYRYPSGPPVLEDVNVALEPGALALLAGPSGGGKSTLLRLFNGLVPQFSGGTLSGRVTVAGLDASRTPARRMASVAGMVFQEPEAQAVADLVEDEIAFGMEQQGISPAEMGRRLDFLLEAAGIAHLRSRTMTTLSGGERQRVAIAAVLALEPELLLLDEPTSQLDPAGATAVLDTVDLLRIRTGLTVAIAEHRLERLLPAATTVIRVEDRTAHQESAREAARVLRLVPPVCELGRLLGPVPLPLTVDEARTTIRPGMARAIIPAAVPTPGDEILAVEGLSVIFDGQPALAGVSLMVREGEVVALMGANGSGKTTLLRAIAGLAEPVRGSILLAGRPAPRRVAQRTAVAGLVPQDPSVALCHESVAEELRTTLRLRRLPDVEPRTMAERWNLKGLEARNPRDLSVGQQQRVAIGAMLAHEPRLWLLDEPTRGADGSARAWLARRLREHARAGGAALVSTHDRESAAVYATRVVGLDRGQVVFDLPAERAFAADGPLPTQVSLLVPGAVTVAAVQRC